MNYSGDRVGQGRARLRWLLWLVTKRVLCYARTHANFSGRMKVSSVLFFFSLSLSLSLSLSAEKKHILTKLILKLESKLMSSELVNLYSINCKTLNTTKYEDKGQGSRGYHIRTRYTSTSARSRCQRKSSAATSPWDFLNTLVSHYLTAVPSIPSHQFYRHYSSFTYHISCFL